MLGGTQPCLEMALSNRRRPLVAGFLLLIAASILSLAQQDRGLIREPAPSPVVSGRWDIPFQTIPGYRYRLERSHDLETWLSVRTLTASSTQARLTDPSESGGRAFWRVVALGPGGSGPGTITDSIPPSLTRLRTQFDTNGAVGILVLETEATDNVAVVQVAMLADGALLGNATLLADGRWQYRHAYGDTSALMGKAFVARAEDAAGNVAFSAPVRFDFSDSTRFAPINGGTGLEVAPDGSLPPFAYRPAVEAAAGDDVGPRIAFDEGGQLTTDAEGRQAVTFQSATFHFEEASILSLTEPLTTSGETMKVLPLEALAFEALAEAFDVATEDGIPVTLFEQFPLQWKGGTLHGAVLEAPQFTVAIPGLPLPDVSLAQSDVMIDLSGTQPVNLPFAGSFALPGTKAVTLHVSTDRPIWLTLCPNGQVTLSGRVEVEIPGAMRFLADLVLEDPYYRLRLVAQRLENTTRDALVARLPNITTDSPNDYATVAKAYREMAASLQLSEATDTSTALLDSWGAASQLGSLGDQALNSLADYLDGAGRGASAAESLQGVSAYLAGLAQVQAGQLEGSAESVALLQSALEVGHLALADRLSQSDTDWDLAAFAQIATDWMAIKTHLGNTVFPEIGSLLAQFALEEATNHGVIAGTFDPSSNTILESSSLPLLIEKATMLAGGIEHWHLLDQPIPAPLPEWISQVILAAKAKLQARFLDATIDGDVFALMHAMRQWQELAALNALTSLQTLPTANQLPSPNDLPLTSLNQLSWQPANEALTLRDLVAQAATYTRLAESLPNSASLRRDVGESLLATLEDAVTAAVPAVAQVLDLQDLALLIEAGLWQGRLAVLLGDTVRAQTWEEVSFPALSGHLQQLTSVDPQWRTLDGLLELFLESAEVLNDANSRSQMKALLGVAQSMLVHLWETRPQSSALGSVDIQLPGDLSIDEAFGEISYHRETRAFAGAFGGSLQLPSFGDIALTVANASVASDGSFDLNAFGSMRLPLQDPIATVSIREDHPLHVHYSPAEGLALSAGTRLEFINGMAFEGDLTLEDPIYIFRIAATDIQFDLLKLVTEALPSFPAEDMVDDIALERLVDFYGALGNQVNQTEPEIGDLESDGRPPTFAGEAEADPEDIIQLYLNYAYLESLSSTPNRDVIAAVLEKAISLTDQLLSQTEKAFQEFDAVLEEPLEVANDTAPRHLLIDFGATDRVYDGIGPGATQGFALPENTVWNGVAQDNDGGLVYSNGTPASDVAIDVGTLFLHPDQQREPDWSFVPSTGIIAKPAGSIPLITDLLADTLSSDSLLPRAGHPAPFLVNGTHPRSQLFVRVRGLGPGFFHVYALIDSLTLLGQDTSKRREVAFAAVHPNGSRRASDSFVALTGAREIPLETYQHATIDTDGNFVPAYVVLGEGEDLLIATRDLPDFRGALSGLEVVEVFPEILQFSATPTSIDLGGISTLEWQTGFATDVSINRGIGSVGINGSRRVSPLGTTRFTLTASNASGSATQSVLIVVDGPKRRFQKLVQGLEKVSRVEKELASTLKDLAAAFAAENDTRASEIQEKLNTLLEKGATILTSDAVLNNTAAIKDRKTMSKVAQTALNFEAAAQALGRDLDAGILGETQSLVDRSHQATLDKWRTADASVDLAKIKQLSSAEVRNAMAEILDSAADSMSIGNQASLGNDILQALTTQAKVDTMQRFGIDPETGAADLSGKTVDETREFISEMIENEAANQALGLDGDTITDTAAEKMIADALAELASLPATDWKRRYALLSNYRTAQLLVLNIDPTEEYTDQLALMVTNLNAQAASSKRLSGTELEAMKLASFTLVESVSPPFEQRLRKALQGAKARIDSSWDISQMNEATTLAGELRTLYGYWQNLQVVGAGQSITGDLRPPALVASLNGQVQGFAQALEGKAIREFTRYQKTLTVMAKALAGDGVTLNQEGLEILEDNEADPFRQALITSVYQNAQLQASAAASYADRLALLDPLELLLGLGLPGELRVEEVYGQVFYNRDTGYLEGSFGGRLTLPETAAAFEISEATIANDGSFSFNAATEGPLPFGGIRVAASIDAVNTVETGLDITGNGLMTVPSENDSPDQTFAITVGYSQANARFLFNGQAEGAPLRFTDNFVVFGAGTTLEVSTEEPFGRLVLNGDAGLFARGVLPATPSAEDFVLFLDDAVLRFENDANGFDLALDEGHIELPAEVFSTSLCPDNETLTPGSGPRITLTEEQPLLVRYEESPSSVRFTGALGIHDVGISIPDVADFRADVCEGRLVFEGDSLPAILDVNARGVLPLPGGVAAFRVIDAMWTLDGLPQGTIQLENDASLFNANGFEVVLYGDGQGDCPDGEVSLTTNADGTPTLAMSGGIGLVLPTEVISGMEGEVLELKGCGGFTSTAGQPPVLTVDQLSLQGDVSLGGENGLAARNIDLVAQNVSALFDPSQANASPFLLVLNSGQLDFPNGVTLALQQGFIAQDGSFDLGATATALDLAGARISGGFAVARSFNGALSVEGDANVTLLESGQSFAAAASYDAPTQTLTFGAQTQNLNLALADDFVLFDGGLGFSVSGAQQSGYLNLFGSFGIIAKPGADAAAPARGDYELVLDSASLTLAYDPEGFSVALDNGTLQLPELFVETICPENEGLDASLSGPAIALNPADPIQLRYETASQRFDFSGQVIFRNIGFEVPGIDGLRLAVCNAVLSFGQDLPRLTNVYASMEIPLPEEPAFVDVLDAEWSLDGLPTGVIALRNDLTLFDRAGFEIEVLGASEEDEEVCESGTAITIQEDRFRLDGGVRLSLPAETLMVDGGGRVQALACGGIEIRPDTGPLLTVDALGVSGDGTQFRLGGAEGLLVEDASLFAFDLQNLFTQSESTPFILALSGQFRIPDGPGFGLRDARFVFDGSPLPKFSIGGADLVLGETLEVVEGLPLQVSEASFSFVDRNLPLPDLLAPDNLIIGVSAGIAIPPEAPIVSGQVNGLTVKMRQGIPEVQLDGFGFGISDFEVPPLSLTGQVYVGGLANPENLFFAGQVGGSLNGAGVTALVAFNLRGPIGICFDVNAGPAGIPLGPTGFLLTGVSGGVSFANSNADPCDFAALIQLDEDGRPLEVAAHTEAGAIVPELQEACSWETLAKTQDRLRVYQEIAEHPEAILYTLQDTEPGGPEFPCPTGECPPRTMNILCQPHPDRDLYPDRIIVKFTSLDQAFVDSLRFTPPGQNQETTIRDYLESSQLNTPAEIGDTVANAFRQAIDSVTPRLDETIVPNGAALNAVIEDTLDTVEMTFAGTVASGVQAALGDNDSVYEAILAAAYAGVPCFDATVKVTGTFSHASVSSFLSGTVGAVLSTAGSAGIVGSVNLVGIPVGTLAAFVAATDEFGDPNPSVCGEVRVAVGPLELGALKALYECDGCVTGLFEAFASFAECVGDEVVNELYAKVAPDLVGLGSNGVFFLSETQKAGILAEIFSDPPNLPGLRDCFVAFLQTSVGSLNPQLTLCGAVQPKIFGLDLGGSLVEVQAAADKEGFAADFAFSPSYLISSYVPLFPPTASDRATFGFGVGVPSPDAILAAGIEGRLTDPQALAVFAREGLDHVLANATYTIGYAFEPFGFKGLNAEARVLMPHLTDHPARPESTWRRPSELGLPSRKDVLLGALEAGLLANPLWTGNGADDEGTALGLAFPEGSAERAAVSGRTFQADYFPHGGIVGAARLSMPAAIVDAPPASLFVLLDDTQDPLDRLTAGLAFLNDYLLQTREMGTMAFYTPAPNPPTFTHPDTGQSLPPGDLLTALMQFDGDAFTAGSLYPLEETFLSGQISGRLLGIPIADAEVEAVPPDPTRGTPGCFEVRSSIPEDSWMKEFVDSADLEFIIKQAPSEPIEVRFQRLANELATLLSQNASPSVMTAFLQTIESSFDVEMPKVSFELEVNNLQVPEGLESLIALDGNTSGRLVAYSPCYDPSAEGTSPLALAKRRGGLALEANLRFLDLVTIERAALGITPGDGALPALTGLLEAPLVATNGLTFRDISASFQSEPAIGQPYLSFDGAVDPITLGSLLNLRPLDPSVPRLRGSFQALRSASDTPSASIALDPARITSPILGDDLALIVHGNGINDRFAFSTEARWDAGVTLQGALTLRDANGEALVTIGSSGQALTGTIGGDGLENVSVQLTIPTGVAVTTFPGKAHAHTLTIGSDSGAAATLELDSNGRLYFDTGTHEGIELPGLLNVGGRLEFGYEPNARTAQFRTSVRAVNFGNVPLHTPSTRTVQIANDGQTQLTLYASAEGDADFIVELNAVVVPPGDTRELRVRYLPTSPEAAAGTLRLQYNGNDSPRLIPLAGSGQAVPLYFASDELVDFGSHAVGGGAQRLVSVANLGQAPLAIDIQALPNGSPFSASPTSLTLAPGEERRLFLRYSPTEIGTVDFPLALRTNDGVGAHFIQLRGTASEQHWYRERQGGSQLLDIAMLNSGTGVAVGQSGALLRFTPLTLGNWVAHPLTNIELRAAAAHGNTLWAAGRSGTLLRSNDAQFAQWTPITDSDVIGSGGNQWNAIGVDSSGLVTLVGDSGRIVKQFSANVFNNVAPNDLLNHLLGIDYTGTSGVLVGENGVIRRSTNRGATWPTTPRVSGVNLAGLRLNSVAFGSNNVGIIVGQGGTILRSSNAGASWSRVNHSASNGELTKVIASGTSFYAVGLNATYLRSTDAGRSWSAEGTGGSGAYQSISEADGRLWAVGQSGRIDHRPLTPLRSGKLAIDPGLLDFGTVALGETAFQTVTFRNQGTGPIRIGELTPFTAEIVASDSHFEIASGGQRVVRFTYRPTQTRSVAPYHTNGNIRIERPDRSSESFLLVRARAVQNGWRALPSPSTENVRHLRFANAEIGLLAVDDQLYRTTDGGESWSLMNVTFPGPIRTLAFTNSTTTFVGGGDTGAPFIYRTTDGGSRWFPTSLPNGLRNPINALGFPPGGGNTAYALGSRITSNPQANGVLLRTTNGGGEWRTLSSPSSTFNGSALAAWDASSLYTASGGTLYRTVDAARTWEETLAFGGAFPITDVTMSGSSDAWLGGNNGLFRKGNNADALRPTWSSVPLFTAATVNDVHFVSTTEGWCATNGAIQTAGRSIVYHTNQGGETWEADFILQGGNVLTVDEADGVVYAGGTQGGLWKRDRLLRSKAPLGHTPIAIDFGEVVVGDTVTLPVPVANLGDGTLEIVRVRIDPGRMLPAFTVEEESFLLNADKPADLTVTFHPPESGDFENTLLVETNAGILRTSLQGRSITPPAILTIDSQPSGVMVTIDGQPTRTPVALKVGEGGLAPGEEITIAAVDEVDINGLPYHFSQWQPSREQTFTFTVPATSMRLTAHYAEERLLVASDHEEGHPDDLPTGPWMRVTEATLTAPGLGDFAVQGSLFLSTTSIKGAVEASSLQIPADPNAFHVFELTAGSWAFDWERNQHFRMTAQAPGLSLLETPITPPGNLTIQFFANGDYLLGAATSDSLPLIPGIGELGPGSFSLIRSNGSTNLQLSGPLRLFPQPNGSFAFEHQVSLSAGVLPFTYTLLADALPTSLFANNVIDIRKRSNTRIEMSLSDANGFSLSLRNVNVILLGQSVGPINQLTLVNDAFTFTTQAPTSPFQLGPFRLSATSGAAVSWDVSAASMVVDLPSTTLRAPGITEWPSAGINFPGFRIDTSGNFDETIPLPAFALAGIGLNSGQTPNRYLRFYRSAGSLGMSVRDQQAFFLGTMNLGFDINSAGTLAGFFDGIVKVDTPVFGTVEIAEVSLSYDSARPAYPFAGLTQALGNHFGVEFGANGGRFRHVFCDEDDETLDDCDPGYFSLSSP